MAERRLFLYFIALVMPVLALVALLRPAVDLAGHLASKTAAYQLDADRFDLVILGDSRTYCAFHPPYLQELLGYQGANLASWSHWLPTQYAQIRDLVDEIPEQATVVWSVGYQNFRLCTGCTPAAYPISKDTQAFFQHLDVPAQAYADNVQLSQLNHGSRRLNTARLPEIYEAAVDWLMQPMGAPAAASSVLSTEERVAHLRERADVAYAKLVYAAGKPTSIEVRFRSGGYERTELDPAFFREQQHAHSGVRDGLELQAAYVELFEAILDLFAERDLRVIVNIMEESPHIYANRDVQLTQRRLMDTRIRQAVEARGFAYVRIDWDRVASDEYFDYNHLNRRGARHFMTQFADRIKPLLLADTGR